MAPSFQLAFLFLLSAVNIGTSAPTLRSFDERPVVTISDGIIVGTQETQGPVGNYVDMFVYRGIPFAKPPINELRFMPPHPNDPWEGELDASKMPHKCPQLAGGVENCLYLNIYTPMDVTSESKLSVMVFIHGGAYTLGSASSFDGVYPLLQHGIILVNIQYRLGILGFLSTGDNILPGNMGLQDQTLALKWVKDNIENFGGDPNSITIFGESAGSSSAHWQVLADSAAGLFNRYILMSGNAFMPWASARDFYDVSRDLARRNGCPEEPSYDLVKCLQEVNFFVLNEMLYLYIDWNFQPFRFGPRVDGDYIKDHPVNLIQEGRYSQVPAMMGVCKNEMALETGEMYAKPFIIDGLMLNFEENGPTSLMLFPDEDPVNTATQAYDFYLGGIDINEGNSDNLTKMYTERCFHIPLDWLVERMADDVGVYSYQFDYRGEYGLMDAYAAVGFNISSGMDWVAHGDDLQYIFNSNGLNEEEDTDVMMMFSKMFTDFAKYGNPTPDNSTLDGILWDLTTTTDMKHLSITSTPQMLNDQRQKERTFWESLPLRINDVLN